MKTWLAVPALALAGFLMTDANDANAAGDLYYSYPFSSYSGSTCTPHYSAVTSWLRSGGWGYNTATSTITVTCPITRRNTDSTKGINFSAIYINNPSGGARTTCTLYNFDLYGNSYRSSQKSTTYAGWQALYFDALTNVATWATYHIVCDVPSHGFIDAYYINEAY